MLPRELQTPPPRDLRAAGAFFAKNRATLRGLAIGAAALPVLLLGAWAIRAAIKGRPLVDGVGLALALGLGLLIGLLAFAMRVQLIRAQRLYARGLATVGTIRAVKAPADRQGNAYVFLEVDFKDLRGRAYRGRCATLANQRALDRKAGDEVAILYDPLQPGRFALYTPGLGIAAGTAAAG